MVITSQSELSDSLATLPFTMCFTSWPRLRPDPNTFFTLLAFQKANLLAALAQLAPCQVLPQSLPLGRSHAVSRLVQPGGRSNGGMEGGGGGRSTGLCAHFFIPHFLFVSSLTSYLNLLLSALANGQKHFPFEGICSKALTILIHFLIFDFCFKFNFNFLFVLK